MHLFLANMTNDYCGVVLSAPLYFHSRGVSTDLTISRSHDLFPAYGFLPIIQMSNLLWQKVKHIQMLYMGLEIPGSYITQSLIPIVWYSSDHHSNTLDVAPTMHGFAW